MSCNHACFSDYFVFIWEFQTHTVILGGFNFNRGASVLIYDHTWKKCSVHQAKGGQGPALLSEDNFEVIENYMREIGGCLVFFAFLENEVWLHRQLRQRSGDRHSWALWGLLGERYGQYITVLPQYG